MTVHANPKPVKTKAKTADKSTIHVERSSSVETALLVKRVAPTTNPMYVEQGHAHPKLVNRSTQPAAKPQTAAESCSHVALVLPEKPAKATNVSVSPRPAKTWEKRVEKSMMAVATLWIVVYVPNVNRTVLKDTTAKRVSAKAETPNNST
tara:strand:+ start:2488 stop:2937 length:450 start_codon:yes stop_codon:yes gene_type:complete